MTWLRVVLELYQINGAASCTYPENCMAGEIECGGGSDDVHMET